MSKSRSFPQVQLRKQSANFHRSRWRPIMGVVLFEAILMGSVSYLMWKAFEHTVALGYALGAMHAAIIAIIYYTLKVSFLTHDATAIHQLRGSLGESNTRDELKRARRRRIIWGWVDGIAVQGGDIDHLVITRRGGLVAIDTKWRSQTRPGDVSTAAESADRARRRAASVLRHLKYMAREHDARHRQDTTPVTVEPLVVMWGAAQRDIPPHAFAEGVPFVAGDGLLEWLRELNGNHIDRRSATQLQHELEQFRDRPTSNA